MDATIITDTPIINDTLRRLRIENGTYPFIVIVTTARRSFDEISAATNWCVMRGAAGASWDYRLTSGTLMNGGGEFKFYFVDEATAVEFKLLFC